MDTNSTPLSVTELNEYTRRLLSSDPLLRGLEVTGEISGYKHHYSGHRYFSLKDDGARVQCVMFRQQAMTLDFTPADGMRVIVRASASLFPRDGSYQLYVTGMRQAGQGDLYLKFEQLKRKLMAEGLFDAARKREIPFFPRKIGIVTSETGAAIRDIIRVARRRNPNVGIIVAPCAVQGEAAKDDIVHAIQRLNQNGEADVLLVGRGGGSIEDLWAFNEECVARAIAASRIPVISCVGHEVDFTIADFVADQRAATPSAAAEMAVPVLAQLQQNLNGAMERVAGALLSAQEMRKLHFEKVCRSDVFRKPEDALISRRRDALRMAELRVQTAGPRLLERSRQRLNALDASLRALNPASVLDRGYAIVTGPQGILHSAKDAHPHDTIDIRLADGRLSAEVISATPEE